MLAKWIHFGRAHTAWLGLVIVLVSVAVPRLSDLDEFVTPDEVLWLTRSANFYYALTHLDLANTYQKEHPGVMVMWAGTAAYLARFPAYRSSGLGQVEPAELDEYLRRQTGSLALSILTAGRFFTVLAHTLLLGMAYLYLQRMLGTLPALLGGVLVGLDPFHIALNRVLHLDGLLSNLLLLSVCAFVAALQTRRKLHLVFSGLVAGLSWLTKSPGLFLGPILGLLIVLDQAPAWLQNNWQVRWHWLRSSIKNLLIWGLSATILFVLLWPAMWVAPLESLGGIVGEAVEYAEGGHDTPVFYKDRIWEDGRITAPEFYLVAYLWRATPFTLLGLVFAAWAVLDRRSWFHQPEVRRMVNVLVLVVVVFALVMTAGAKKFDRYILPVFAPLDLLAGLGYTAVIHFTRSRLASLRLANLLSLSLIALACGGQLISALGTAPYYLTYYNPLLGGANRAQQVMQIGWGEGLDQAGRYLSQKENARDLLVSSWYARGPFSYFFSGKTRYISNTTEEDPESLERLASSDYAVIYIHQWQRGIPRLVLEHVSQRTPEHTILLNGIEYVRIYKIR